MGEGDLDLDENALELKSDTTELCALCHKSDDLIVLWDGKFYCHSCLRSKYPALYSFYEDSIDKSLPLRNSYGPARMPHAISFQVQIRNVMFIFLITVLCFLFFGDGTFDGFLSCLFLVLFLYLVHKTFYPIIDNASRFWARQHGIFYPSKSYYSYPRVMIHCGRVEVEFYSQDLVPIFTFAPSPFRLVFNLSEVALVHGDSHCDSFYRADPMRERKEVLLLDFSRGLERIRHPKYKLSGQEYNAWLKSPVIVCCIDPTIFGVWKDFFAIIGFPLLCKDSPGG